MIHSRSCFHTKTHLPNQAVVKNAVVASFEIVVVVVVGREVVAHDAEELAADAEPETKMEKR